jgi:hypothetical protein
MNMDEEDIMEGLEELYRDGDIDHVPGIGSDTEPAFKLNDSGRESARQLLRDNDGAVLMLVQLTLNDVDRPGDSEALAEALDGLATQVSEDAGVNVFRVLKRHGDDIEWLETDSMSESFLQQYDHD